MKHFTPSEFDCSCCGANGMDSDFLAKLDRARDIAGIPFFINSGYRCADRNTVVGGSPTSSHLKGCAADIDADTSAERFAIISALVQAGFTRIGISPDFIHVDSDSEKPGGLVWLY